MTKAWQVRAGSQGERDNVALDEGLVIIGWEEVPDLRQYTTKVDLKDALRSHYPGRSESRLGNWAGQLWRFVKEIEVDDFVVMPLKSRKHIYAIGKITGQYEHRSGAPQGFRHVRPVQWIRTDVKSDEFRSDLRGSMGSLLTVCRLRRHDAPKRIAALANGNPDSGWQHELSTVDQDATLFDLWTQIDTGGQPVRLTVRELLSHWDYKRRTAMTVSIVQDELDERGLSTRPSFITAPMNSVVELVQVAAEPESAEPDPDEPDSTEPSQLPQKWIVSGLLDSASPLECVKITDPIVVATTRMLRSNYSQLPVLNENGHPLGAISWESIGYARLQLNQPTIKDATVSARVINYDDDLFGQINEIFEKGYVFVRASDSPHLAGIITAHDLTQQFGRLAYPFSLAEEAELRVRLRTQEYLSAETLSKYAPGWNKEGNPTFGSYKKLLSDESNFSLLNWPVDHASFLEDLECVVSIRNELMHFSQDALPEDQISKLGNFVRMLRNLG